MRILASILSILYISFSIGISVSSHYCMGMLKDVSFGFEAERCVCADSDLFADCCEDVHHIYQVDEDQQLNTFEVSFDLLAALEPVQFEIFEIELNDRSEPIVQKAIPPPKICESRISTHSLILYA